MFCTACEIEASDLTHYKSTLHGLNSKRKLLGYPPLTSEEIDAETEETDLTSSIARPKITVKDAKVKFHKKCAFCDEIESDIHYKEHGFTDEQIYFVNKKQCYVCNERFCDVANLIQHLELDVHRTTVSDGVALYLDNGKVLNPSKNLMPVKLAIKSDESPRIAPQTDKIAQKVQEDRRVLQLKISVEMNGRWGKWLH